MASRGISPKSEAHHASFIDAADDSHTVVYAVSRSTCGDLNRLRDPYNATQLIIRRGDDYAVYDVGATYSRIEKSNLAAGIELGRYATAATSMLLAGALTRKATAG